MLSNKSSNSLHNEQITTNLDKIRKALSRARAGNNRKSQYGNWYYPQYPTHINQFIPTLKARGKQTSIILPEFWEVMTNLILENSDRAFESFEATINSIENQSTYFVKHELSRGALSKQPRDIRDKSSIRPIYFFLPTTQFACAPSFTEAHQFVNVAKKQRAQRYLNVIYKKIREINIYNDYHKIDLGLGAVSLLEFWQELCIQNPANDDDSVSVSISLETPVKVPSEVAIDRPTSIKSELTDATSSPNFNLHQTLALQNGGETPPEELKPRTSKNQTTPLKKPANTAHDLALANTAHDLALANSSRLLRATSPILRRKNSCEHMQTPDRNTSSAHATLSSSSTPLSNSPAVKKAGAMLLARVYNEANSKQNSPARSSLASSSALYQTPEKTGTNNFTLDSSPEKNITLRPHQRRSRTEIKKPKGEGLTTPRFRTP